MCRNLLVFRTVRCLPSAELPITLTVTRWPYVSMKSIVLNICEEDDRNVCYNILIYEFDYFKGIHFRRELISQGINFAEIYFRAKNRRKIQSDIQKKLRGLNYFSKKLTELQFLIREIPFTLTLKKSFFILNAMTKKDKP